MIREFTLAEVKAKSIYGYPQSAFDAIPLTAGKVTMETLMQQNQFSLRGRFDFVLLNCNLDRVEQRAFNIGCVNIVIGLYHDYFGTNDARFFYDGYADNTIDFIPEAIKEFGVRAAIGSMLGKVALIIKDAIAKANDYEAEGNLIYRNYSRNSVFSFKYTNYYRDIEAKAISKGVPLQTGNTDDATDQLNYFGAMFSLSSAYHLFYSSPVSTVVTICEEYAKAGNETYKNALVAFASGFFA